MLSFLFLNETSFAQKPVPVKLQLKWYHQFQFAGYYAAQKQGYYQKEGLSVDILEGNSKNPPVQNVLEGKANFGVTGSDILFYHIRKKPVVVLSVIFQHSAYVFLSLPNKKISSPSDLVGKRIMASNDQGWVLLKALFLREGIPLGSFHVIPHSWNNMDLINGKADAMTAYSTVEPAQLKQLGYDAKLIKPIDYGIDFYGDLLFTTQKEIDSHPKVVEAFNRASLKGWDYAMAHPKLMADYILRLPGVKERKITKASLLFEAAEMRKLIMPELVEIGHINPGRWQNMLNTYSDLGLAKKDANLKGFLYQSIAVSKLKFFDTLIYIISIGIILFLLALLWNWQLRKQVFIKTKALNKANSKRRKAEEHLELAIDASGLGLMDLDLADDEVHFNESWVHQFGFTDWVSPMPFVKWSGIIHPHDKIKALKSLKGLAESRTKANRITYRIKTHGGDWRWVLAIRKISGMDELGNPTHILSMLLDIDVMKQKEIELKETTKELLKTNVELQKFASITSHNLRAPIVNLLSLTEMNAQDDLTPELEIEIREKIQQSVKQLDTTLKDLIEIVSSKSGEKLHKEVLHFESELADIMLRIEAQIHSSEALIETDFSEASTIYFPKHYLENILINLLSNSINYRSNERKLVIRIKTQLNKNFTVLIFNDNGSGINLEKFKNKIFGLYQRFHPRINGKGLGLYIIKSQIESMDGKIEVNSIENEGTTFRIYLPNSSGRIGIHQVSQT